METNQNDCIHFVSCIKNVEEYYLYAFGMVATRQGHFTACCMVFMGTVPRGRVDKIMS